MSFHDKAALKAASMGETSAEFRAAAQKHANFTWAMAILAGVVWYFLGAALAFIPAALGVFAIVKSASSTMVATRLEKADKKIEPRTADDG
jgi:uncharacterized membrane protein (DUF485 family)